MRVHVYVEAKPSQTNQQDPEGVRSHPSEAAPQHTPPYHINIICNSRTVAATGVASARERLGCDGWGGLLSGAGMMSVQENTSANNCNTNQLGCRALPPALQ